LLCIGVATSKSVTGPYVANHVPIARDSSNAKMGYIDATYHDNHLIWKHDGNAVNLPTPIVSQRLFNATMLDHNDTQHVLIKNDLKWEGPVVEGPWFYNKGNWLYLFYSANGYDLVNENGACVYAVGVARARNLTSKFEKFPNPILSTPDQLSLTGPGHCSVVNFGSHDIQSTYMIYHAWSYGAVGGGNSRHMVVDRVTFDNQAWPVVNNDGRPSTTSKRVPY